MITMRKGDLIHIPQDVDMWDYCSNSNDGDLPIKYFKTQKPTIGVFLKMDAFNTCRVFANGQETSVALRCIYPMEQTC